MRTILRVPEDTPCDIYITLYIILSVRFKFKYLNT